ncbi:MAG: FAD-binding oxidoreductase [Thermoleophilia bacterium]
MSELRDALAARVAGPVAAPGDPGYTEELTGFNLGITRTPELVVAATSTDDVAQAMRFARENGLRAGVLATGHGETQDGAGLVISTRRLNGVSIDPGARTATIGGGSPWGPVIAAAAPHGLAPSTGSSPLVGVVGFLLGGGLGPLARTNGFGSDRLLRATVVTGAGEVVSAAPDGDAELLWALRGGGGGLGVVTDVHLHLDAVPHLYAGNLVFGPGEAEAALRGWVDWVQDADPRVTTSVLLVRPPVPDAPPFVLMVRFAFAGPPEEGEALAAPLRALAPVAHDGVGPMALTDVAMIHQDPEEPVTAWVRGDLLDRIDFRLADTMLATVVGGADTSPFIGMEVRHIAGATAQDVPEGSAVAGRGASYVMTAVCLDPSRFAEAPAGLTALGATLDGCLHGGMNPNFAGPLTAGVAARCWPGETGARLAAVRRRLDPDGVLAGHS